MTIAETAVLLAFPGHKDRARPRHRGVHRGRDGARALRDRLDLLHDIAPDEPLSVLVVALPGNPSWDMSALAEGVVRGTVRVIDTVVALGDGRIGVVLQAAGSRHASQAAARIQHRLQRSAAFCGLSVLVAAASGTGRNGRTLLTAAAASLAEDAGNPG